MKILRFWGIPIHKILSDDDFVERAQKHLKRSKKYVWIHIAAVLFVCVFLPKLIQLLWHIIELIPEEGRKMAWIGLMLGLMFGAFIAQYIVIAGQAILMALDLFDFNRSSKLLIKYHDMLKENGFLEEEHEEQEGQIFAEENNDIRSSWDAELL